MVPDACGNNFSSGNTFRTTCQNDVQKRLAGLRNKTKVKDTVFPLFNATLF